jgi:hypothetical protein
VIVPGGHENGRAGGWQKCGLVSEGEMPRRPSRPPISSEQFQQKWEPILRPELRLNNEIEHFR